MTEAHLSAASGVKERVSMKAEVFLPDDYRPAEDEPFMNDRQLEYFLSLIHISEPTRPY